MKALFFSLLLTLSFAQAANQEINVSIKGMVCQFCAQGLEKAFKKNEHVQNVKVDMDKKIISLSAHQHPSLNDEGVTQIVKDAGYDVEKIERK